MSIDKMAMNQNNTGRQLVEDVEGYRAFEEKYGMSVELYLSTLSLPTLLYVMNSLKINFTDVTFEELLEGYEYQSIVETIDGEIFEKVSALDKAIEQVKKDHGLIGSAFKREVMDTHKELPILTHGNLTFKPLSYKNILDLEKLRRNDVYTKYVHRNVLSTMSPTAFISELQWQFQTSREVQFLIYKGDKAIGTLFGYDYSATDGHMVFSLYLDESAYGSGVRATLMFLKFAFEQYDLQKIYTDVYDINEHVVNMWQKVGAHQEGYAPQHRKGDNAEWIGLYRFALYKDEVMALCEKFLK